MKCNNDNDKWLDSEMKSMFKVTLLVYLISVAISISGIVGIIYFVFWCLKHFGLIN